MEYRIKEHPILNFERREKKVFRFKNQEIEAYDNEPIAVALYAAGVKTLAHSHYMHRPRGFFCAIGKCSSCIMRVNGIPNVRTCITPVENGMIVEDQSEASEYFSNKKLEATHEKVETDMVVIGAGPAGLTAAIEAIKFGAKVVIIDDNPMPGGQLIKQTHKFFGSHRNYAGVRGIKIADILIDEINKLDAKWYLRTTATAIFDGKKRRYKVVAAQGYEKLVTIETDTIVAATGAMEKMIRFENNDLPGVYGAGGIQTLMNVYGVKPGKNVLIVGAGNVGVIIGYQLMQAGVNVKMVVEAAPRIGAYLVHAVKLRRLGVPILTSHTVIKAHGTDKVEGATIVKLDEKWKPIPGTEEYVDVDVIALAVGLSPSSELLLQAGCKAEYIRELGGMIPLHNKNNETTKPGIFIAGDVAGIEEASTAMINGRIAAISALKYLNKLTPEAEARREEAFKDLEDLRGTEFSKHLLVGKEKVYKKYKEYMEAA